MNIKSLATILGVIIFIAIFPAMAVVFAGFLVIIVLHHWWSNLNQEQPTQESKPFKLFKSKVHSELEASNQGKLSNFLYQKKQYLKSEEWQTKRKLVLARDNYTCQSCGEESDLQIHHLSGYDLIPNEPLDCLVTLCSTCHDKHHKHFGFPVTYEGYMQWQTTLLKS